MGEKSLAEIEIGASVIIRKLRNSSDMKKRLMSIGLVEGTKISPIFKNASGSLRAYGFRGSVFAIRNEDAKSIIVEPA